MPDTYHVLCGDRRQRWAAEELRDRGFVAVAHGVPELESWPLPEELSGSLKGAFRGHLTCVEFIYNAFAGAVGSSLGGLITAGNAECGQS